MNKCIRINKSDNSNIRNAKKLLKRKLKSNIKGVEKSKPNPYKTKPKPKQRWKPNFHGLKFNPEIQNFYDLNKVKKSKSNSDSIELDEEFSLYKNPAKVLWSLLHLLYKAKTYSRYVSLSYKGHVSFGALYFIDTICSEIGKKRNWVLRHNLPEKETLLLANLKSISTSVTINENAHIINNRIRINRTERILARQNYLEKSKEIRDLINLALKENDSSNELTSPEHNTIDASITEYFDNILLHVPDAEYGFLCGYFNKETQEVTLLIYNFGNTIAETLSTNALPEHVQIIVDKIIANHMKNAYFIGNSFTNENALTLLAIQEGVSSKLSDDKSRGHGIMDVIEKCKELNPESKSIIISGKTAIKINSDYSIQSVNLFDRERRIIAFNEKNDIFEKPNKNNVLNLPTFFPGVIIETVIPLRKEIR